MKDPVVIERSDLEQLADILTRKVSEKAILETLQMVGVKPRDVNRTLDGVSEVQRFCFEKGVRIGRRRIEKYIPYKRHTDTGRYQFKERDVLKFLNK